MGLRTTHLCWDGGYIEFDRWRTALAKVAGIDFHNMEGCGGSIKWDSLPPDPIHKLLNHSDCRGEIAVEDLITIADRLDQLCIRLLDLGMVASAIRFSCGLRLAASLGEAVEFH